MPAQIIPHHKLTAYQRWELAALHEDHVPHSKEPQNKSSKTEDNGNRVKGYESGFDVGYQEGRNAAKQQLQQISDLLSSARNALIAVEQQLADDVLDLAIELARQVLRGELTVRRDALLPVVSEAMNALSGSSAHRKLLLHPSDVDIVRSHLGEDIKIGGWQIIEDHLIEPGGCRVVTVNGDIDATLATRWKGIVNSLDRSRAWHDE
jgi:flagellar assembly protein FliH